ncbi:MAG: hypothetical protein RugAbin2_02453, partial [Rugosibacter sp.]|nr:hypothetical protein [Rugosibacter sp.]
MEFLAHVKPDKTGGWETHELAEHLREVARRTEEG